MNVRRFVGRNAREAMAQARAAFGEQTVVLANRPVPGGVEILAMAGAEVPAVVDRAVRPAPPAGGPAAADAMSTLSFQDFVRERQRLEARDSTLPARPPAQPPVAPPSAPARFAASALQRELEQAPQQQHAAALAMQAIASTAPRQERALPPNAQAAALPQPAAAARVHDGDADVRAELRQMRSMLASQFAGMTWFDTVRRSPTQTRLLRLMIGNGFSPALARRLLERLPPAADEAAAQAWLARVLERNLKCAGDEAIQRMGGVFALVGPTGVGKTTTTAKIAARFALEHGAASVGLITVDTYRMAASDQLRAYGRILNIPVHTACDAASLADLLSLLGSKRLVLVDTVGLGQRDRRLPELFASLPAGRLQRLLVLNAGAQGETLEEVVQAYGTGPGMRCAITKLDEAARTGAVVDVVVRHKLRVEGIANGQRVPEDWHAVRAQLLAHKALLQPTRSRFLPEDDELGLMLTAPSAAPGALRA